MRKIGSDYTIESWFLDSVDFADVPVSLEELSARYFMRKIDASSLIAAPKWEPIFRGHTEVVRHGWVPLSDLASIRRGIATGSNDFFLIRPSKAKQKAIRTSMLLPCVGRAMDVKGRVFRETDYDELHRADARCLLMNLTGAPDQNERAYICEGEADNLPHRYLLANRRPWYSMEQRTPAPIWAAVFGRGDLGFVYNQAGVRSLTNFHCVYPREPGNMFARALAVALNAEDVREGAKGHVRGYGGGLMKFEPNDLKSIQVPDLRRAQPDTLAILSGLLDELDCDERDSLKATALNERVNKAVRLAGREASNIQNMLF